MSEELENEEFEDEEIEEPSDTEENELEEGEREYSDTELEAMKHGWRPPEEFDEDDENKKFVSADEFLDRQKFFDEINALKKRTRKQDEIINALKDHNQKISERMYDRAMEELKSQRKEAIEDADGDKVEELDKEMQNLDEEYKSQPEVETTDPFVDYFNDWVQENTWYNENEDLKEYADAIGRRYVRNNPSAEPEEVFSEVENKIKKQFPEYFGMEKNKKTTKTVQSSNREAKGKATKKSKKPTLDDLPEGDKNIAQTLIRTGTITEEEYLSQYFGE